MPRTYEPIASQTLGSDAATVTFSSIPQTYTDLVLVVDGAASGDSNPYLRVGNGSVDTGSNYSVTRVSGESTGATSGRGSNLNAGLYNGYTVPNNERLLLVWHLMSYANTNVFKTALTTTAAGGSWVSRNVALWRSTAAIDIMTVRLSAFNYRSGSTFSLYGIKAA